jgi:insulysin
MLLSSSWPPEALAERVAAVTPESLERWVAERLDTFAVTGLLHGNFDRDAAQDMAEALRTGLALSELPLPEPEVVPLQGLGAVNYAVDIEDEDATMVLYLQANDDSLAERALLGLSAQILRTPYFNDLRTEQQLGYVVMASPMVLHRRGDRSVHRRPSGTTSHRRTTRPRSGCRS